MQVDLNIQKSFTPETKELFEILAKVAKEKAPNAEVFAVGGFIRDSLVGIKGSKDIDIMVTISGKDFAYMVTNYIGGKDPHVVKVNPEKSKFLETVVTHLKLPSGVELDVDFAQARSEIYTDNSRIPVTKPATPEEDSYRRDFTVNSLMWKIYPYPQEIKDFTGKGIQDLIANTLRTPQDPLKTFKEDPLRIFRCIRLSSKYNFSIDPETYSAMKDPSLREDIKKKLARERSATEIEKMLKGPNPLKAISLLYDTGLFSDILEESLKGTKYEGKMSSLTLDQRNVHHKLNVWEHSMQVVKNILDVCPEMEGEKKIIMVLAALFHDLGKLYKDIQGESKSHPGSASYHGHEEESAQIVNHILRYLKMESYIDSVSKLAKEHMHLHKFTEQKSGGAKALRRFIRNCGELSLNWLDVFNLSVADAYSKNTTIEPETVNLYKNLEERLNEALLSLSIKTDEKVKPILDGNEIMRELNIKPGLHMKEITDFVKELKDEDPNITKEKAITLLKEKFGQKPIVPPIQQEKQADTKESKKDGEKSKSSTCPKHLFANKCQELNIAIEKNNLYEANTILKSLIKEYSKDESIARLVSSYAFKIILKDNSMKDLELLQYLFNYAQENFFDYIVSSFVLGILLIIETATKDDVILEVANRTYKLSPITVKYVLDFIPPQKICNQDIYKKIKNEIIDQK